MGAFFRMYKRIGKRKKQFIGYEQAILCLDTLYEQFIHAKLAEGRSKRTIDQYLDMKGIERAIQTVTTDVIRDYIVWMLHEQVRFEGHQFVDGQYKTIGLSPVTVITRIKTLSVFFGFLSSEKLIIDNPMRRFILKNIWRNS